MPSCKRGHLVKLSTGRATPGTNLVDLPHMLPKMSIHAGLRRIERWLQAWTSHSLNRPAKSPLNLLNLLKEKQQQHARERRGRECRGLLLLFFEFLAPPSEARPEHPQYRPSGRQRRGSTPLGASESASRHTWQGEQGDVPMAQPGTDGQNPVLKTTLGTDLARQGAYRPLGRAFLAWEYPDLHQPC